MTLHIFEGGRGRPKAVAICGSYDEFPRLTLYKGQLKFWKAAKDPKLSQDFYQIGRSPSGQLNMDNICPKCRQLAGV